MIACGNPVKEQTQARIVSVPRAKAWSVAALDDMLERWEEDHDLRGDGATSASAKRKNGTSAASRP
jgi:hypothetical protein